MKLNLGIIAIVTAVLVVILLPMLGEYRNIKGYVVGSTPAKTAAIEQQQKQNRDVGPSPMPAAKYDFWRGEESLVNPVKNALDSQLSELSERFTKSNSQVRANIRSSISVEEISTLLSFSRRSAVFSLRERNVDWVRKGLTAVAMIEGARTDFRDILMTLSLVYHSAKRVGADADQLFKDAAKLSDPSVSQLLTQFAGRPSKDKDLRASWGYDEVETKDGMGFIEWGAANYRPNYDVKSIALDIADMVTRDKYQPSSVQIADTLPPVWLESKENSSVKSTLNKVRGGASVMAKLRPNEHATYQTQVLMVFLVEAEDERVAQDLLDMSRKKKPTNYSMIGIAHGSLFCLVVGESFQQGVASFETAESLSRFAKGITEILKKYSK